LNNIDGMPGIIRVDHIGVAVFDLNAAIDWYTSFMGAKLLSRETNREQMIEEAILILADSRLQLISPLDELSTVSKFLESRGQGMQQIAFQVANLESAVNYAREQGVRVIYEKSRMGTERSLINFLHPKDCFGVLIELVEIKE
jgi:methylmalonyl-CoA/ethylmalonyl-CoA epimerase